MTDTERNEVLTKNWPLIRWAGSYVARRCPDLRRDEAVARVAFLAVKRFHCFDPVRGTLGTWMSWQARRVVTQHRREQVRRFHSLDFDRLSDPMPRDEFSADLAVHLGPRLAAALDALPAAQRNAVKLRYGLDWEGERELADIDPGVSPERNRQRVKDAERSLRQILTGRRLVKGGAA